MDYNDVPVFVRVVETGSFTRAAHALGLQKSSVSRTIGRLESELGVRLLQRTTRQLSLTDAGQQFYDAVRSALTHVDDAVATVRELGGEPRGLIRMTAPSGADVLGLADMIVEFGQRYPAISIDIVLTGRFVDLVSEGFDLAIRAGQLEDSQLVATRIMMSGHVLFAAPSYLDKRGRPTMLEQLAEHQCVLFKGRGGSSVWPLTGPDGVERELEVSGALSVDELSFAMRASQAGAGIALLPPEIAAPAAMSGALEVVLPDYYRRVGPIHIVLPSAVFIPSRVALFRDHLVERLQQMSARVHAQCTKHTKISEATSSDRGAGAAG
jgi:DNA-binding transcriptional LysR family regulator